MKHLTLLTIVVYLFFLISCNSNGNSSTEISQEVQIDQQLAEGEITETDTAHLNESEDHDDHDTADHKIYELTRQPFSLVYKTSGMIQVDSKDEVVITAKSPGIIRYEDHFLFPGVKITSGTKIFTISGDDLTENNTNLNFARVEADYIQAKLNLDRAELLIPDRLITEEHYLSVMNDFAKIKAEYNAYNNTGTNGASVRATESGYIKDIYISEGERVLPGDKLASIIIEHNMVLKAEVAPSYRSVIGTIKGANFSPSYSDIIYSTEEMHGKMISFGRSTEKNSFYIPIYFRFDFNQELIPGTFTDVWLIGDKKADVLLLPNSSILEEYGKFYVFVEDEDGDFEKRYFIPGQSDGIFTEILSGLNNGEHIVSEGAYQIKMSMMTSLPAAQSHNH